MEAARPPYRDVSSASPLSVLHSTLMLSSGVKAVTLLAGYSLMLATFTASTSTPLARAKDLRRPQSTSVLEVMSAVVAGPRPTEKARAGTSTVSCTAARPWLGGAEGVRVLLGVLVALRVAGPERMGEAVAWGEMD